MYKKEDKVTLNGDQMNTILNIISEADVNKTKFLKMYFNEELYLRRINELKQELALSKKSKIGYIKEANQTRKQLELMEDRISSLCEAIEKQRQKKYENGELKRSGTIANSLKQNTKLTHI